MLAPHEGMWSGDVGKIRATEHCIDLKSNTRPIRQHPYRAGAESRKVLEDQINLQLHPIIANSVTNTISVMKMTSNLQLLV